jgi:WD40 repeat protein/serine/threonine protein kinase
VKGYQLRERIGKGGFGAIYRAYQPVVEREVAIKIILPERANQPEFIRHFEAEAKIIARLEHPYIVPLFDYWRDPYGAYLVMRWLRGGSLRQKIMQSRLDLDAILKLLDQITSALAIAHRNGVVHRDLKPDNILLDEEGNAYLTDFGIAQVVGFDSYNVQNENILGSMLYISPEQLRNEPLSPHMDIYSLGIMLFELVTGRHPFEKNSPSEMLTRHLTEPLPDVRSMAPEAPEALNPILQKATSKTRSERYGHVQQLLADFRRVVLPSSVRLEESEIDWANITLINPYKGLRAFEEADAADFFGRETLVNRLLERLAEDALYANFLAIVGPSGSGKSSVVSAGLIPATRRGTITQSDKWFILEMVPGDNPTHKLATTLLSVATQPPDSLYDVLRGDIHSLNRILAEVIGDGTLMLFIDQFEEVFTMVENEADRAHFLKLLHAAVTDADSRLKLVVTLRADFYGHPLLYEGFGVLVQARTQVVLPLVAEEIERAITAPAHRVGLQVDTNLIAAIVSDVREEPGGLPLLQYALTEVFERRDGRSLTLSAYQDSGGVLGALARRAEDVYRDLTPEQQRVARQLFLRLVTLGEGTEDTRRRVHLAELRSMVSDKALIQPVLDVFGRYRLLTFDIEAGTREPLVEVAHEAIIREWGRLREWLNASRAGVQLQRALTLAASDWAKADKDNSFLLRGTRLAQFEEWAAETDLQLTAEESGFLQASIRERERQVTAEAERQAQKATLERRAYNRLRQLVSVMAIAVVVALGLFLVARDREQTAQTQEHIALRRLREIQLLSLSDSARRSLEDDDPELALALAYEANRDNDAPFQVRQMLYQAAYAPGTRVLFDQHSAPILNVTFSPDGTLAASSSGRINPLDPIQGHMTTIWDTTTGQVLQELTPEKGGHTDTIISAAFSPDGRLLASSSLDAVILLWDVQTGEIVRRLEGHNNWIGRVAFSPDGTQLISISGNFLKPSMPFLFMGTEDDWTVRLWEVASGQEIRRMGDAENQHTGPLMSLDWSDDGQIVATGDAVGNIFVWEVATGKALWHYEMPGQWVNGLALTPDNKHLLAGVGTPSIGESGSESDFDMLMWDLESNSPPRHFDGHTNVVITVAVSPDGKTALSGSGDRTMRWWDLETGTQLRVFNGHKSWVFSVAFSPDGRRALSGSTDSTARIWDLYSGDEIRRFDQVHTDMVRAVDISRDGTLALSGGNDGQVLLWDVVTGHVIRKFGDGHSSVNAVSFSPDEQYAVSAHLDGAVNLWDVATGQTMGHFTGHTSTVLSVAFSSDGQYLLTGSGDMEGDRRDADNTVRLWDVATGEELRRFEGCSDTVWAVGFSSDDRLVFGASGHPVSDTGDNAVRIWDRVTGQQVRVFSGFEDKGSGATFSPDDKTFVSVRDDGVMQWWDMATGKNIRSSFGQVSEINTVIFTPDGQSLLTAAADGTIRLWDADTGEEIYRYGDGQTIMWDVAITADGRTIISGDNSGRVWLWRVDDTADELKGWIGRNRHLHSFTCDERAMYRLEPLCDVVASDQQ